MSETVFFSAKIGENEVTVKEENFIHLVFEKDLTLDDEGLNFDSNDKQYQLKWSRDPNENAYIFEISSNGPVFPVLCVLSLSPDTGKPAFGYVGDGYQLRIPFYQEDFETEKIDNILKHARVSIFWQPLDQLNPNKEFEDIWLPDFVCPNASQGVISFLRPFIEFFVTDPDAFSSEPDASSSEPDASSSEPDASSSDPDAFSSEPDASSSEPDASSSEPGAKQFLGQFMKNPMIEGIPSFLTFVHSQVRINQDFDLNQAAGGIDKIFDAMLKGHATGTSRTPRERAKAKKDAPFVLVEQSKGGGFKAEIDYAGEHYKLVLGIANKRIYPARVLADPSQAALKPRLYYVKVS